MNTKKLLRSVMMLVVVFCFCEGMAMAQTGTVEGTITNEVSGEPLIGASVYIPSIQQGSATNAQGHFSINDLPFGTYQLRVSYIGYTTKTLKVTVDQETVTVNVALSRKTAKLGNIVVTAQGVRRTERSIGASVQEISGDALAESHVTNFSAALTGKVAGLQVQQAPTLGGSANVLIRGVSSITGGNQPLYIINGIPFSKNDFNTAGASQGFGGYSFASPLASLNANNIKSITVLKGAAATALYGSRGANGVIKIQTKSGANQHGLGLTLRQSVGFSRVYGLPNYQHKYGGGPSYDSFTRGYTFNAGHDIQVPPDQYFANYSDDESWGPRTDGRLVRQWYSFDKVNGLLGQQTPWIAHPNNVQKFFETGLHLTTTVGIANGGENFSYHISMARTAVNGSYPLAKQRQKQFGFNGRVDLSDDVHAVIIGNYSVNNLGHLPATGYVDRNVFQQFNQFGQVQLGYGPDSYLSNYKYPDGSSRSWNYSSLLAALTTGNHIFHDSPYWVRHENYANQQTRRFYGKVGLTYDIFDFLSLNGQLKTSFYHDRRDQRTAKTSVPQPGYTQNLRAVQEVDAQVRLTYQQDVSQSLTLNAFVEGGARYNNEHHNHGSTAGGLVAAGIYNIQNSVARPLVTNYYQQQRVDFVLGQVRAGYNNLLFLTLSGRNEWSSTLPVDNNSYQYYAATGSFIFTDVGGLDDQNILSFGKLRVSYAKAGHGAPPYSIAPTYAISLPFKGLPRLSVPTTLNNANLEPELTHEFDVGIDLKFINNRIGLDVTYYHKRSTHQIIPVTISRASGYARQFVNAGKIVNHGIDATLHLTPIRRNGFSWNITANFAVNNNEVVKLVPNSINTYVIGNAAFTASVVATAGEEYGQIRTTTFVYYKGKKVVGKNGYYLKNTSLKTMGSYLPDWTGSVSTSLHYKGFSASVAFNGQKGGKVFSISNMFGLYAGIMQPTARGHVRPLGLIAKGVVVVSRNKQGEITDAKPNTIVADVPGFFHHLFGLGEAFTYDASYIKLRQARLAYSLPVNTFGGNIVRGLTVAVYGQNLMTIFKNAPNFDPSTVITAGNFQGVESGRSAPQRIYGFSVQVQF